VLAVHGIAGSHMVWRTVAREITGRTRACLLAPDLRGRGRSAGLPDPFGMATHISDLTAVRRISTSPAGGRTRRSHARGTTTSRPTPATTWSRTKAPCVASSARTR
jgi:pimeloyl-ACP methyl ester carboxylesterase